MRVESKLQGLYTRRDSEPARGACWRAFPDASTHRSLRDSLGRPGRHQPLAVGTAPRDKSITPTRLSPRLAAGCSPLRFWPRATRILKVPCRPSKSSGRDTRSTRGASLARPKAVLGVVLLSLHGSAAGHARFDRSKNSTFSAPSGPLAADEGGERTSDFSKPAALRGLDIAFGLRSTTPSGVLRTLFTTGRGAPLP